MERLDYDLMFRWFVGRHRRSGLGPLDLLQEPRPPAEADIARRFLKCIPEHQEVAPLLSDEPFTVDGTLVTAFAEGCCCQRTATP
jgi:hypothetical protein